MKSSIKETPKKDFLMVQGDFYAKVGKYAFIDMPGSAGRNYISYEIVYMNLMINIEKQI